MAEAIAVVSLISTIAQLVDFGTKLIARVISYQKSIVETPKIFKGLEINLPLILDTLKRISTNAKYGYVGEATQRALVPVILACHTQIKALDEALPKIVPSPTDTFVERGIKAARSIRNERKIEMNIKALKEHLDVLTFYATACSSKPKLKSKEPNAVFMVPFERDPAYLDRPNLMIEIDEKLKFQSRVVLNGMGGVGKSQIAIEYCYNFQGRHPDAHVLWLYVSTWERAVNGWAQMARRLKIPGCEKAEADILELAHDYLSDETHGRWLMILDNADEAGTFYSQRGRSPANGSQQVNSSPKNLVSYLPRSKTGQIIITTRDKRVGEKLISTHKESLITVPFLTLEEALKLLRSRLSEKEWDETNATKLLTELDCLPLAITQAAALISQNNMTIMDYLESLYADESEVKELLGEEIYDVRRDQDNQTAVLRTLKVSFEAIEKQRPRAIEIISLMAVLDRQGIPKTLLRKTGESSVGFNIAMGTLQAFSLITAEKGSLVFGMHRLVQLSTHAWLEHKERLRESQIEALKVVTEHFPEAQFEQWEACESLIPHAQAVLQYASTDAASQFQRAQLLYMTALFDREQGRYGDSERKMMEGLDIKERILGREHPEVLDSLTSLGLLQLKQGKYSASEETHRKVFELRLKVLGDKDRFTWSSLQYLGSSLWWQGKYEAAKKAQQQALEMGRKSPGKEDAKTLASMSDLAVVLLSLGDFGEAERMFREALKMYTTILGETHRDTIECMSNLGYALESMGSHEEGEAMHRRTWSLMEEVLGPRHPRTIESLNYVSGSLLRQGNYARAEMIQRQVLALRTDSFGEEHPETVQSVKALAGILDAKGEYKAAETLHRQAIETRSKVLSKEHPDTLESMSDLAGVLGRQNKLEKMEEMHQEILVTRLRTLGKQNPFTLDSMDRVAGALWAREKFAAALDMQKQALEARQETQGPDHPYTLASMDNVVGSLWGQGKLSEATEVLRRALALRETKFGEKDPETLIRMTRLAFLVRIQGEKEEALELYQRALEIYEKTLGPDDPTTQECAQCMRDA